MLKIVLVDLLVIFWIACKVQSFVQVKSIDCKFSEEYCAEKICSTFTSRSRIKVTFVNIGCFIKKPVDRAQIRFTLYRKSGNTFQPYIIDIEENLCSFMKNIVENPILYQVLPSLNGRLRNFRCPLIGNITLTKQPILLNLPPGFSSDSQYKIGAYLTRDKTFVFAGNVTFNKDGGRLL